MIELLAFVQDLTRPEPECVGCWLSEEDGRRASIRYSEQWASDEALYSHIQSSLYRRVLAAMELCMQPPEVRFYYCNEVKGLELIEAARRTPSFEERTMDPG